MYVFCITKTEQTIYPYMLRKFISSYQLQLNGDNDDDGSNTTMAHNTLVFVEILGCPNSSEYVIQ